MADEKRLLAVAQTSTATSNALNNDREYETGLGVRPREHAEPHRWSWPLRMALLLAAGLALASVAPHFRTGLVGYVWNDYGKPHCGMGKGDSHHSKGEIVEHKAVPTYTPPVREAGPNKSPRPGRPMWLDNDAQEPTTSFSENESVGGKNERRDIVVNRPTTVKTLRRRTTKRITTTTPKSVAWFSWPKVYPGAFNKLPTEQVFVSGVIPGRDATARLQAGINECYNRTVVQKRGRCEFILSKGVIYQVTGLTIPTLMMDFTWVGNNATLMFSRTSLDPNTTVPDDSSKDLMVPPLIDVLGCRRCEFKELKIDWNWKIWRIASLAKYVQAGSSGRLRSWVFDIQAPPIPPKGGVNTSTFYAWQSIHPVDPTTLSIGVYGKPEFYLTAAEGIWASPGKQRSAPKVPSAKELPPGAFDNPNAVILPVTNVEVTTSGGQKIGPNAIVTNPRVAITFPVNATTNNFGGAFPGPIGSLWMIKHITYQVHGIRLQNCVHCFFTRDVIRSTPGKAIWIDRGSSNIVIDGLTIDVASPVTNTTERPMSNAADGIFAAMSEGNILIQNSQFGYLGDDPINIHVPTAARGYSYGLLPDNTTDFGTIIVQVPAWRIHFAKGAVIQFFNLADISPIMNIDDSGPITRTIGSASYNSSLNGGTWTLTITEQVPILDLPQFEQPETIGIVNQAHFTNNVIISNVLTRYHRARGILIQSKNNVVVEKSQFYSIATAGIMIRSSLYTQEGVGTENIAIANNYFYNVDVSGKEAAVVVDAVDANQTVMGISGVPAYVGLNAYVRLNKNIFERVTNLSLEAAAVWNLTILANRISIDPGKPFIGAVRGRMIMYSCGEIMTGGNMFCAGNCRLAINMIPTQEMIVAYGNSSWAPGGKPGGQGQGQGQVNYHVRIPHYSLDR